MRNLLMAAAVGDICGSVYEHGRLSTKDYDKVVLFADHSRFTDDTVCTFACAEALIDGLNMGKNLWARCWQHPAAGYGGRFSEWLQDASREPYYSFGNGSAMRCSAAAWMAETEEECRTLAKQTASCTHDHPDGIKGAVATALAIFYLKNGATKEDIQTKVLDRFYPEWSGMTYEAIKPDYRFYASCQGTVGPAILCFLRSKDYEDCIKLAIALGGDADTLAAISGPMAYAYYKEIPEAMMEKALAMLPEWMLDINRRFDEKYAK